MLTTVVSSVVSLVVGTLLGAGWQVFTNRPKIRASGSVSVSADSSFTVACVSITNEPGFYGIRIGRTVLFGRAVWSARNVGMAFDRNATKCSAYVVPADGGQGQQVPIWSESSRPNADGTVTIPGGESDQVYVFAKRRDDDSRYFVFEAEAWGDAKPVPRIGDRNRGLESPQDFVVHVSYAGGAHDHAIPVAVKRTLQGSWQVDVHYGKHGSGSTAFI